MDVSTKLVTYLFFNYPILKLNFWCHVLTYSTYSCVILIEHVLKYLKINCVSNEQCFKLFFIGKNGQKVLHFLHNQKMTIFDACKKV